MKNNTSTFTSSQIEVTEIRFSHHPEAMTTKPEKLYETMLLMILGKTQWRLISKTWESNNVNLQLSQFVA